MYVGITWTKRTHLDLGRHLVKVHCVLVLQELAAVRGALLAAVAHDIDTAPPDTLLHILICTR